MTAQRAQTGEAPSSSTETHDPVALMRREARQIREDMRAHSADLQRLKDIQNVVALRIDRLAGRIGEGRAWADHLDRLADEVDDAEREGGEARDVLRAIFPQGFAA